MWGIIKSLPLEVLGHTVYGCTMFAQINCTCCPVISELGDTKQGAKCVVIEEKCS